MSLPPPVLARPLALPSGVLPEWWRVVGDLHPDARAGAGLAGWSQRGALAEPVLRDKVAGYGWGGCMWGPVNMPGEDVLDCSGFVSALLGRLGVLTTRTTSSSVASSWPVVPPGEVAPGDVVWWSGHVGIVIEPGRSYLDSGGEGRESVPTAGGGGHVRARRWTAREGGPRSVHRPPLATVDLRPLASWLAGQAPAPGTHPHRLGFRSLHA